MWKKKSSFTCLEIKWHGHRIHLTEKRNDFRANVYMMEIISTRKQYKRSRNITNQKNMNTLPFSQLISLLNEFILNMHECVLVQIGELFSTKLDRCQYACKHFNGLNRRLYRKHMTSS